MAAVVGAQASVHRTVPRALGQGACQKIICPAQRILYCVGEPDLAARAADRAMVAAEETGDPILIAVSAWTSTMAALGRSDAEEAHAIAHDATGHLRHIVPTNPAALSAWGHSTCSMPSPWLGCTAPPTPGTAGPSPTRGPPHSEPNTITR
ncbi:hypothetical protein ACGF0J_11380 [Nonomuraea sp. NPDC047897]|uniref:hypothetical protein n=1 Tax=Nonomuraea sp. NPDC047897 TaxID=3364346 RepID=UPI00371126D1